jgi:molybdopterin/thiamine biosynthesis adenylyltransferase
LSGQFFLNYEEDVTKNKKATRGEACISRLQQLNFYVKCNLCEAKTIPLDVAELEKAPFNFHEQDVIILTEASNQTIEFVDEYCRKKNKKFIITDVYGVFSRIFNDFGEKFEVIDKNGEDL